MYESQLEKMSKKESSNFNFRLAESKDADSLLHIVNQNLLSKNEKRENPEKGFITYDPSYSEIKDVIQNEDVVVSEAPNGDIAGYLILMEENYAQEDRFFKDLYKNYQNMEFEGTSLKNQNPIIFAQDAIKNEYKGSGVFTGMIKEGIKRSLNKGYSVAVGEIHHKNDVSMNAHSKKAGFQKIGQYDTENHTWNVIATNLEKANEKYKGQEVAIK